MKYGKFLALSVPLYRCASAQSFSMAYTGPPEAEYTHPVIGCCRSCGLALLSIFKGRYCIFVLTYLRLIVWDEIPMIKRENVDSIDWTLHNICSKNEAFGEILTISWSDFHQPVHVVNVRNYAYVENSCINWKEICNWVKEKEDILTSYWISEKTKINKK